MAPPSYGLAQEVTFKFEILVTAAWLWTRVTHRPGSSGRMWSLPCFVATSLNYSLSIEVPYVGASAYLVGDQIHINAVSPVY